MVALQASHLPICRNTEVTQTFISNLISLFNIPNCLSLIIETMPKLKFGNKIEEQITNLLELLIYKLINL